MRLVALSFIGCLLLAACAPSGSAASAAEAATGTLQALQANDSAALAALVHPDKGVRFTPYSFVKPDIDVTLTPEGLQELAQSGEAILWGQDEGPGQPIVLTLGAYLDRYARDHDFAAAPDVLWNEPVDRGTMINNAAAIYPGAEIVEYHFPGFDPQYGGMDWRSLRLALEEKRGRWYVVGIIHDEWTP